MSGKSGMKWEKEKVETVNIGVRITEEEVAKADSLRGDVKLATFLGRLLKKALGKL